jgi:hypothetical protein
MKTSAKRLIRAFKSGGKHVSKIYALVLGIALIIPCASVDAYSNRTYERERLALHKSIAKILINHGLCSDVNDCNKKQYALSVPNARGLSLEVYGVKDTGAEIIEQCALTILNRPQMEKLDIKIYPISKAEQVAKSIFSSDKYKYVQFEN